MEKVGTYLFFSALSLVVTALWFSADVDARIARNQNSEKYVQNCASTRCGVKRYIGWVLVFFSLFGLMS